MAKGENDDEIEPAYRDWGRGLDRVDRRRLCFFQCGGFGTAASSGGFLEQYLVPAVGVRGDQLHEQRVICVVCGDRIVDRGLFFSDLAESRFRHRAAVDAQAHYFGS